MENRKIFDPKFVHFMWDDGLKGKEGFIAPTIRLIIDCVENNVRTNHWQKLEESHNTDFPFHSTTGIDYGFVYYDPLYDIKWAWKQGKQIQTRWKDSSMDWKNVDSPQWTLSEWEYRVKPEKKWRPFKDIQELKNVWYKRVIDRRPILFIEPVIWVRSKAHPVCTRMLTGFLDESSGEAPVVAIDSVWNHLDDLFKQWEFLDGTPCGVEE